jgi:hypothetical protein
MSLTRVQNFSVLLDGFATSEGQSLGAPFGHAGERPRVAEGNEDLDTTRR